MKTTYTLSKLCCFYILTILLSQGWAQSPVPEIELDPNAPAGVPQAKNIAVRVQASQLPNTSSVWQKIIVSFESIPKWNDGIYVYVEALMRSGERLRILHNSARLLNVKKGLVNVPFYLSPLTIERFGEPVAIYAMVVTGEGDGDILQTTWFTTGVKKETLPETWRTDYLKLPGLLLHMFQTPWLLYDYGKTPDFAL